MMQPSIRAFLDRIVDYAGLFPPAKLPLDEAIRNFSRYLHEPNRWMLGRFILPAARLSELRPYIAELFADGPPLEISALGRGGETRAGFVENLAKDIEDMAVFLGEFPGRATIDVVETKLPPDVAISGEPAIARSFVDECRDLTARAKLAFTPFFEISLAGNEWRPNVAAVVQGVRLSASEAGSSGVWANHPGVKLRTGGLEPSAFPTPEQVGAVIACCRDRRVPLKCTAGLHHPIRHFADSVQTHMHGFLNVWGAAILAHARQLDEATIAAIIADESAADALRFDADNFFYAHHRASVGEIINTRALVTSFGSCSFDEPLDDLRTLKLL